MVLAAVCCVLSSYEVFIGFGERVVHDEIRVLRHEFQSRYCEWYDALVDRTAANKSAAPIAGAYYALSNGNYVISGMEEGSSTHMASTSTPGTATSASM